MSLDYESNSVLPTLQNCDKRNDDCPRLPGTILRINIPAGAVINLLNLIEVTSPGGICLIVRLPLLGGNDKKGITLANIQEAVQKAGGSIEFS